MRIHFRIILFFFYACLSSDIDRMMIHHHGLSTHWHASVCTCTHRPGPATTSTVLLSTSYWLCIYKFHPSYIRFNSIQGHRNAWSAQHSIYRPSHRQLPIAYCLLHTYVRHPLLYRCSTFRSLLLLLSSRDRDGRDRKKKGRTTTIISVSLNIFYKKTTAAAASRRCIISCWYTVLQRYQPSSRAYYCQGVRTHSVLSPPAAVAVTNSLSSYFIAVQFKFL